MRKVKIILYWKNNFKFRLKLGLKLIEIQNVAITLYLGYFLTHLKQWAIPEKVGDHPIFSLLHDREE